MARHIAIIDGHPDPQPERFCHALANAYTEGAVEGGHEVRGLSIAALDIPILRSQKEWQSKELTGDIKACQEAISFADHVVIIFPLWLGTMPALLKAFLEQVFRPGFAIQTDRKTMMPGLLKGKSARIIVTMGMPKFIYRWYFRAHSLKSLERNILKFAGMGPIAETIIGSIDADRAANTARLAEVRELGRRGI